MPNKKITELTELTTTASSDVLAIVDVGASETKKIQVSNLPGSKYVKVSLSNADVLAMKYDNTPITLVAAQASKIIVPISCVIVGTWSSPNESSSDDLRLGWNAASSTTSQYWASYRDWFNGVSSGTVSAYLGGQAGGGSSNATTFSLTNQPFQVWCTDVFNGGWTADVYLSYYLHDA